MVRTPESSRVPTSWMGTRGLSSSESWLHPLSGVCQHRWCVGCWLVAGWKGVVWILLPPFKRRLSEAFVIICELCRHSAISGLRPHHLLVVLGAFQGCHCSLGWGRCWDYVTTSASPGRIEKVFCSPRFGSTFNGSFYPPHSFCVKPAVMERACCHEVHAFCFAVGALLGSF